MSRIYDAGTAENQYEQLPDLLDEYEGYFSEAKEHLRFKGKTIKQANMENPVWQSYYDQKRIEVKSLVKHFENEVKRVEGKLFRNFKEKHSRELGEREITKYIANEDAYIRMRGYLIEVEEMYGQYESLIDAFRSRGYALNNITKAIVAQVEDNIL